MNAHRSEATDPVGNIRQTQYDVRNLPNKHLSGLGADALVVAIEEVPTYNAEGALISVQNGRGHVSLMTYDGYGRPRSNSDPLGNASYTSYDANSNARAHVSRDALGTLLAASSAAYDPLDRVASATRYLWRYSEVTPQDLFPEPPAGAESLITTTAYDPASNVVSVEDPLGRATTFGYDAAERLVTSTDADTNTRAWVLDAASNVRERHLDERGADGTRSVVPSFSTYDGLGRPLELRDAMGNKTALTHDARNHLRRRLDPTSQFIQYAYDGLDRMTQETKPHGITITHGYDLASRQIRYTDALGGITQWAHDAANRTTSVTHADAKTLGYSYDETHNLTSWTDQRGTMVTQVYDAAN